MFTYIVRRCLLLPMTLFFIVLVNFAIINLAPGEPVTVAEISAEGGAVRKEGRSVAFGSDERYLFFREHFGLTLPILFNWWPFSTQAEVEHSLNMLATLQPSISNPRAMTVKAYDDLRIQVGDQARFIMPKLVHVFSDPQANFQMRQLAVHFFIRGGSLPPHLGPNLSKQQKQYNRKVADDALLLRSNMLTNDDTPQQVNDKIAKLSAWYQSNKTYYHFDPSMSEKIVLFFFETRFCRYMSKVLTLDFGTMRNDHNKTVISEVTKRFKYSLTLALVPMLITFFLCQFFAFIMALNQQRWPDHVLNFIFLLLYATPIFVVAPFLIEKVALNGHFPFTNIPIPISGFTSPAAIYDYQTTWQRLGDVLQHIYLPIVAITYGSLAAQTRLSRTAILEVLRQDYVRTAWAKGASLPTILIKHVGRNAAITIVTSIAGSLAIILGGSLIVETIFEINGFGKFFYDAVINRDYNVIMFSTLAGSFLALLSYLMADITYTLLDPRVSLE